MTAPGDDLRVGLGFDVHRFAAGRSLVLGGEPLAHDQGLEGHSDADVLTHAVIDALLGAAGLGDIGRWFPDTDPAYRGADSLRLLAYVRRRLGADGWRVVNVDATVVAERPRLAPHVDAMAANLAEVLEIDRARVSIKATTSEGLGFAGRGEGIAALATCLLSRLHDAGGAPTAGR
ncbi:MAG TPA: 2-C-methyl-D-erythritol 2,4-cyclodiphosphate synthase [Bacillota bacterium]